MHELLSHVAPGPSVGLLIGLLWLLFSEVISHLPRGGPRRGFIMQLGWRRRHEFMLAEGYLRAHSSSILKISSIAHQSIGDAFFNLFLDAPPPH